jgi:aspartate aminotransferase-like enzyme
MATGYPYERALRAAAHDAEQMAIAHNLERQQLAAQRIRELMRELGVDEFTLDQVTARSLELIADRLCELVTARQTIKDAEERCEVLMRGLQGGP